MSKTVTVRRGEKLPENMVNESLVVWDKPIHHELKPGDEIPLNALEESYTVEVHDDPPPQAYLIVPCERGKGTHWPEQDDAQLWGCTKANAYDSTYKQIPCALTLEDLRWAYMQTKDGSQQERRFVDTIAAWDAVPQPKEAGR